MSSIGKITESGERVSFSWQIDNFSSFLSKRGQTLESPVFYFCGRSCRLKLRLHTPFSSSGATSNLEETPEWVGLSLNQLNHTCSKAKLPFLSLEIKTALGMKKMENLKSMSKEIPRELMSTGCLLFIHVKDELEKEKDIFLPMDQLTVVCKFQDTLTHFTKASLFSRLWKLSRDMIALQSKPTTDIALVVQDKRQGISSMRVHKAVLEARSEYFSGMFRNEMQKNASGQVKIDDIDLETLQLILYYIYSGDISLQLTNVCKVFVAADKMLLGELKDLCSSFIRDNMNVELVCDLLRLPDLEGDAGSTKQMAIEYISKNGNEVMSSDAWEKLKKESISLTVMETCWAKKRKTN